VFATAEAHPHALFRRAIERRALWAAEDAARELPNVPLEDALQLVYLYADRGSPKFEPQRGGGWFATSARARLRYATSRR